MATKDRQITTWLSKQVEFDYDAIQEYSDGESVYFVLCMRPDERALLLSSVNFYADWSDRWVNFPDELTRSDLLARTNESLVKELACSEDIELIITHLAALSLTMTEIRDRLGPAEGDINGRLADISVDLEDLKTAVDNAFPTSIFDQLEPVLNGVGVILGAPDIPLP